MALDTFNPYLFVSAGEQSNKYLTPTYADGIAEFQAQRAQSLTGLTVRIEGVQEGTGDPSPTNIRPISGRTGLTVTRVGKNLFNQDNTSYLSGNVRVYGSSDVLGVQQINRLPAGTYTLSFSEEIISLNEIEPSDTRFGLYIKAVSEGGDVLNVSAQTGIIAPYVGLKVTKSVTFTLTEEYVGKFTNFYVYTGKNNAYSEPNAYTAVFEYIQFEFGSTATDYEPYTGNTLSIDWETEAGTVYAGTLDVVSGVLTVDWGYIASYNGEALPGEWISDRDVYAEGTTPTTGAEVAYKLAEPVTYQLDPEQIKTIPGYNQIYSDAGQVIDIKF